MGTSTGRETTETKVEVSLKVNGSGRCQIETGIPLLNHMLSVLAMAGEFDMAIMATGDLPTGDHHTVEDVGITLGQAIVKVASVGVGSSVVPSRESLATAAVRLGEPCYVGRIAFRQEEMGGMALENFSHFLHSLAYNGRFTLHLTVEGGDDHSKVEAAMMALGRALKEALVDGDGIQGKEG
jgi:imidazoleglycerol-phosphate dehydratase